MLIGDDINANEESLLDWQSSIVRDTLNQALGNKFKFFIVQVEIIEAIK